MQGGDVATATVGGSSQGVWKKQRGQSLGVSVLVSQASCSREHWSHPCPCCASTANWQSPGLLHRVRLSSGRGTWWAGDKAE